MVFDAKFPIREINESPDVKEIRRMLINGTQYKSLTDFARQHKPKDKDTRWFVQLIHQRLRKKGLNKHTATDEDPFEAIKPPAERPSAVSIRVEGVLYKSVADACKHYMPKDMELNPFIRRIRARLNRAGWEQGKSGLTEEDIDFIFTADNYNCNLLPNKGHKPKP